MMPPDPTGPFKPGDRILDKWEVRGILGRGGHAFVYDCFNAFLNQEVAIKVIPNVPHRGNQLFNRARGEAQFLYKANHPNVVRVMDAGEIEGMAYIVMEKLEGLNLRQLMRKLGPLTVVEALTIALPIAEALQAAHAMGVIHRDLKPENIFLLPGNEVKVLDFGIAKFIEGGYQTTQRDLLQGTAPYMSPEQAQGLGVTFASDISQLGTIIYEMIAGICPCMIGLEEPTQNVILAIQIGKMPPRLKSVVRGVSDAVDRLVWRAIVKEPHQRYPEMSDFAQEIRNALKTLFAELPEKSLMRRVVNPRPKTPSQPPAKASGSEALSARTTPIALAASMALPAAAPVGLAHTEQMPAPERPTVYSPGRGQNPASARDADRRSAPPPVERKVPSASALPPHPLRTPSARAMASALVGPPSAAVVARTEARGAATAQQNDRFAARRMLLRAVLIGLALAVPIGLGGGLWVRSRAASPRLDLAAAPAVQDMPPGASSRSSVALGEAALSPAPAASVSPSEPAPAPSSAQVAASPIEPKLAAASARSAAPLPHAAPAIRPATAVPASSPPLPSAAAKSKAPKAAASATEPKAVHPLIF